MIYLLVITVIAMFLAVGLGYYFKQASYRKMILASVCIFGWAIYYRVQLENAPLLLDEKKSHIVYMNTILIIVPVVLLSLGVLGFIKHQRDYLRQYKGLDL